MMKIRELVLRVRKLIGMVGRMIRMMEWGVLKWVRKRTSGRRVR